MTAPETQRDHGIDLLRILSMLMVVLLHVLRHGGVLDAAESGVNHALGWLLEAACLVAVNCFALISGYVGIRARHRVSGLLMLWVQVFTYSAGAAALFAVFAPFPVKGTLLLTSLLPLSRDAYWYFSRYCGLFVLMPMLNAALRHMRPKEYWAAMTGILLLFSGYLTVSPEDPFAVLGGYSTIWLAVMYLLGGGIRLYVKLNRRLRRRAAAVYLLATLGTFASLMLTPLLRSYNNLLITAASIALFLCFAGREIRAGWLVRCIGLLSPLAFAVYLTHTQPLVWEYLMQNRFQSYAALHPLLLLPAVLGTGCGIFVVSAALEWGRQRLQKLLHLRPLLERAEDGMRGWIARELRQIRKGQ